MSILVALYFFMFAYVCWIKRKALTVACYLCLIYGISGMFAFLLENSSDYIFFNVNIIDVIVFCALLTLTILPFFQKNEKKIEKIILPNKVLFNIYCFFVIISSIIVITRTEFSLTTFLLADYREIRGEFYKNMNENQDGQSLLLFLPRAIAANFAINLACFFYSFTFLKKPAWFNILLLLATLAPVVEDVATGSRTTAVYWIMLFGAFFIYFKKFWNHKKIKIAYTIIGSSVLVLISYIAVVTVSRFSLGIGVEDSFISYIGQPFLQFSRIWNNYEITDYTTDRLLPLTSKYLLGHYGFNVHEYRELIETKTHITANGFPTFIGDTVFDIGRMGAVLFVVLFFLITSKVISVKKTLRFEDFLLYTVLLRYPLHGIFAYVYYTTTTSLTLIITFFLYYLLKKSRN